MRRGMLVAVSALLVAAAPPKPPTPNDIVAESPIAAWKAINPDNILVIDMKSGGRVIIQLAPGFAPVHVANVKALARADHWRDATIYRVQDNYVAQWGNNDSDKPWPAGVNPKPPAEYTRVLRGLSVTPLGNRDPYAPAAGFADGWPVAYSLKGNWANLAHCYASVGVGRELAPDTGTGGELYAVIGHGPRQLDRNIALIGRVLEGIERLSTLPRGTEALGFYKDAAQYVPIARVRIAADMPPEERPHFQVMDTRSRTFARYLQVRIHRFDDFYRRPALGVDLCNVQVPVRRAP
ncbi:MAG: peptidylprolyl isomerase [Sphingomicrobium sp.]